MPYYKTCKLCGASLDPGEKCTCEQDKKQEAIDRDIASRVKTTLMLLNTNKKRRKDKK